MRKLALLLVVTAGCDDLFHLRKFPDPVIDAPTSGLLAQYTFETFPADKIDDVTGHGHDAMCVQAGCPVRTDGPAGRGNAGYFDGTARLVVESFSMASSSFTVAFWLRADTDTDSCPVNRLYNNGVGIPDNSWQLCVTTSNAQATFGFFSTDSLGIYSPPVPMMLGSWHHVAIRLAGGSKAILYDGTQIVEGPGTTDFDASPIVIGSDLDNAEPVAPLDGALDDLRIYDVPLTDAEIRALE